MALWTDPIQPKTTNGCGFLYYGWEHNEDDTAEATCWFVLFFLPVVPLRRYLLRLVHDPTDGPPLRFWAIAEGLKRAFLSRSAHPQWEHQETLALDLGGVIQTYLKTYALLPLVLFGIPAGIVLLLGFILGQLHNMFPSVFSIKSEDAMLTLNLCCILVWMVYCIFVIMKVLDSCHGGRPSYLKRQRMSSQETNGGQ